MIIAFVTQSPTVQAILSHIAEPAKPPSITPARGPPAGDDEPTEAPPAWDPLAQPEPEYEFDQRVQW